MRTNTIILLLLFSLILFLSFFVFKLNSQIIKIDLLFLDVETSLGKILLSSLLSGILLTLLLESLYMFFKKRND